MFAQCSHGYIALTCPACNGRSGQVAVSREAFRPGVVSEPETGLHYSGASLETRQALAAEFPNILMKAEARISQSMARENFSGFLSPAAAQAKAEREGLVIR